MENEAREFEAIPATDEARRWWWPRSRVVRWTMVGAALLALLAIIFPYALGAWLIFTGDDFIPYPDGPPPGQQAAPRAR